MGALLKRVRSLYTGPVTDNTSFVGTKLIGVSPSFNLKMETDLLSETCYVLNTKRWTRNNKMLIIAIANIFGCTYMLCSPRRSRIPYQKLPNDIRFFKIQLQDSLSYLFPTVQYLELRVSKFGIFRGIDSLNTGQFGQIFIDYNI